MFNRNIQNPFLFFFFVNDFQIEMPREGLRNSLIELPRTTIDENSSPSSSKSRKRTRKVLHPIATDVDVPPSTENVCPSPARRARLLDPRETLFRLRIFSNRFDNFHFSFQKFQLLKLRYILKEHVRFVVEKMNDK